MGVQIIITFPWYLNRRNKIEEKAQIRAEHSLSLDTHTQIYADDTSLLRVNLGQKSLWLLTEFSFACSWFREDRLVFNENKSRSCFWSEVK